MAIGNLEIQMDLTNLDGTIPTSTVSAVTDKEITLAEASWIDLDDHSSGWVVWGLVGKPGAMKSLALAYQAATGHRDAFCTDGWEAVMDGTVIKGFKRE